MQPIPSTLTRRKQLRPRLRRDLVIRPQRYEGRTCYLVKDPVRLAYFRFQEAEYFLMRLLDGRHTLEALRRSYERRFRPERLALEEVEGFVHQLASAGLMAPDATEGSRQLLDRARERRGAQRLLSLTNLLCIRVPIGDPDRLLSWLLPGLRWLFSPWFFLAGIGLIVAASGLVITRFDTFRDRLPALTEFFSVQSALLLGTVLVGVKVLHEFGHGLTCKAFGGEVHEMGVLVLGFVPALYCDVTDAWTLPSKWRRMLIGFAGIYVELVLAALATFVWWQTPGQPLINHLCLYLMIICSVSTVIFNGNPLMRFDGYYILADWLEVPNLSDRAGQLTRRLVLELTLGVELAAEPVPQRRILFAAYAVASFVYRWVVTGSIVWFCWSFFKPHDMEAVGLLLAALALASLAGWPLLRLVQDLRQRGRLPDMKPRRILVTAGLLGALAVAVLRVPLPLSHVRQTALVRVRPDALERVYLPLPGVLRRVHVRNGQHVAAGELLAEFRNLEVEDSLEQARTQRDICTVQQAALREQVDHPADPLDAGRLVRELTSVTAERNGLERQVRFHEKSLRNLELRAPRTGVVLGLPTVDAIGCAFDARQEAPFCSIADPDQLQALVPLGAADYRLLREDIAAADHRDGGPIVSFRVPGQGARRWYGRVVTLPEGEAAEVPLALTSKAGGPVPVRSGTGASAGVPLSPQYLVTVDVRAADAAIYPGALIQVGISGRWHTAGWWLWRTLATTFDVGLY